MDAVDAADPIASRVRCGVVRALRVALVAAALGALGACASFNTVRVHVATPQPAPTALAGARVQLQADPADAASPDAAALQRAVVDAMTRAGLHPVLGETAPYSARYSYGVYLDFEASFPSAWPPPGPPVVLPDGRVIYRGWPIWGPRWVWPPPWYERALRVEIRRLDTGAVVWSSGAVLGSFDERLAPVAAILADAAFSGFPQASGKRVLRVQLP
ncbi:hypothetical protein GALL_388310 [mine drainage metagenome]|jgi:hypothetical protein|uniref:DUF4136 domain-containing protein n=1 Tax=mine drainage metagenome TaxID=410659 RepID=A0A1J5Q7Q8_9ZZZZ